MDGKDSSDHSVLKKGHLSGICNMQVYWETVKTNINSTASMKKFGCNEKPPFLEPILH